jgi:hypothetical protein
MKNLSLPWMTSVWRTNLWSLHGFLYRLARIHWNPCKWFVVTKTCLPKRWLLSDQGPTVDCVTAGIYLPKRCLADGHIPSQCYPPSYSKVLIIPNHNVIFTSNFPMHATYSSHPFHLDLITLTILGQGHRLWSSSSCNFLHHVISSALARNNFFSHSNQNVHEFITSVRATCYPSILAILDLIISVSFLSSSMFLLI